MTDWIDLATNSHYRTAVAIRDALQAGELAEVATGLDELIGALHRAEGRALEHHLVRLMQHILLWKIAPEKRSIVWQYTISLTREAIRGIREDTPSLTQKVIEEDWEDLVEHAARDAEALLNRDLPPQTLTWQEVLEDDYSLQQ